MTWRPGRLLDRSPGADRDPAEPGRQRPDPFRRAHRQHAVRVALVAVAVTAIAAVATGAALDAIVARRLGAEVSARLADRLRAAAAPGVDAASAAAPRVLTDGDGDYDDAPSLLWLVAADGSVRPLSAGAPSLPDRRWRDGGTADLTVGGRPFRVRAVAVRNGWLVAGESVGPIEHVTHELVVTELLLGGALLVAVYLGALAIGLRASAPVEEVRRRQAAFTADASHELRTPLSVIEAEVGLALGRPRSDEYYRETLQRVAGESGRLRHIVDDLLWLARSDAGTEVPSSEPVDLAVTAAGTVDRFGAVARERGLHLELVAAEPATVMAPDGWLGRLLGVLLDNACRYCAPGGRIRVSVTAVGGQAVLAVDDDGPGIPAEERPRVFDRFHRVGDLPGGTGLGLAIANSVVRTTGGEWLVDDSPLGGARFQVTWRGVATSPRTVAPVGA